MNKLYRIKVLHGGPKDSHTAVEEYLIADNEEQVFKWIDKQNYNYWSHRNNEHSEEEESSYHIGDDYNNCISFKEWVMLNKGDLDDEYGWEDAFYGVTKFGWEEMPEVTDQFLKQLVEIGIAKKYE